MSFFYNIFGDDMKIYIDLLLILNFAFDFLLLLSVSIILKRNVSINKILLGAFLGGLSIFTLFLKLNSFQLFIIKLFISIIMVIISFQYKNIKYTLKNLAFLYLASIILGGFLYLLNIQFSYKNEGLVFYHSGLSINFIILIIFSPIIIYIYIRQCKSLKTSYSNYYKANLYINDNMIIKLNVYLDTGNNLTDPYKHRPIILLDKKEILFDINEFKMVLVPFSVLNGKGLLKCIKVKQIDIEGVGIKKNFLVGIMEDSIKIDGVNCIMSLKLLEE